MDLGLNLLHSNLRRLLALYIYFITPLFINLTSYKILKCSDLVYNIIAKPRIPNAPKRLAARAAVECAQTLFNSLKWKRSLQ